MAVDLGELLVGLRANDPDVVDALRHALAPLGVDGVDVFPNLSLYVSAQATGGPVRGLHRLHRRGATVLRTPSVGHLVRSALRYLEGFLPPPPGLVPLRSQLVIGSGGAILVNEGFDRVELNERRLARLGWARTDGLPAFLDPTTLEVVVPEPRLALDPAGLAAIDARWPRHRDESAVAPGRHPIRGVLLIGTRADHLLVTSPARRWASLASVVDTSVRPVRAVDVAGVGRLDGEVEVRRVLGFDTAEIVDQLRDLAS